MILFKGFVTDGYVAGPGQLCVHRELFDFSAACLVLLTVCPYYRSIGLRQMVCSVV